MKPPITCQETTVLSLRVRFEKETAGVQLLVGLTRLGNLLNLFEP